MKFLKGQYFSFDAIVAAVIFVMALSILFTHWYTLSSQMDEQTYYLQNEANRISDLLLGEGIPSNWWANPSSATRAGLAASNSTFAGQIGFELDPLPNLFFAQNYLKADVNPVIYDQSRALMATSVQYYAKFDLGLVNSPSGINLNAIPASISAELGNVPPEGAEIAIVRRPVFIQHPASNKEGIHPNYIGNMTLYAWEESSRS